LPDGRKGERNMYTEREALKEYIEYIREERKRLGEEYWKAIQRLKEIDSNHSPDQLPSDILSKLIEVVEKQNSTVEKLNEIIPPVPVEAVVELFHNETTTTTSKISTDKIEREKEKDEYFQPIKKQTRTSRKDLANRIGSFLKEMERPAQAKEIKEFLEEEGYKFQNISEVMRSTMEYNSRVDRAMRGYYQYK
jgi:hypothetical protein